MNKTIRNILAVIAGIITGSAVNMGLIMLSGEIIPPPHGADITTAEGLKASMPLFGPQHFVFPFLAHAFGTLAGSFIVARFAVSRHLWLSLAIGAVFLIGGITNVSMLPSPVWFSVMDLIVAYLPMAFFGYKLGSRSAG